MANGTTTETATTETPETPRIPVDILKPETCPPALAKFYDEKMRENVRFGLENGSIVTETKQVKISAEKSGTGKDELWPFILYRAVKPQGMTLLARGKGEASKEAPADYDKLSDKDKVKADFDMRDGACDFFNYGFSLTIMQPIRVMLASKVGGVDKEIAKQVTQVMKTGLFADENAAKDFVLNQRKANEERARDLMNAAQ